MSASTLHLRLRGADLPHWVMFLQDVLGAQMLTPPERPEAGIRLALNSLELSLLPGPVMKMERGVEIDVTFPDVDRDDFYQRLSFNAYRSPAIAKLYQQLSDDTLLDFNGIRWRLHFVQ